MRKSLLLLGIACMAAQPALSAKPRIIEEMQFLRISPDGNTVVSEIYGSLSIVDLKANKTYDYVQDETGLVSYSVGLGNAVSNVGIVVGGTSSNSNAAYWDNGRWIELKASDVEGASNLSAGITPDGARICSSIGNEKIALDSKTMLVPGYWDRNADGSYGDYHLLPHPEKDVTGGNPQFITALCISDDGKVIAGQERDARGMTHRLIVYTQDDNGEWSYRYPLEKYFNPDGIVMPENPGDSELMMPIPGDFMSPEEKAAYDEAVNNYDWTSGAPYPMASDFMTPEEIAAYEAELAIFNEEYGKYNEKLMAFFEAYEKVVSSSLTFVLNDLYMSPDGRYLASTREVVIINPETLMPETIYYPVVVDLETGEYTQYDEKNLLVTGLGSDGTVIGATNELGEPRQARFIKDGKALSLVEYLQSVSPANAEWAVANMTHSVEQYFPDPDTGEYYPEVVRMTITGTPIATPDLKTIVTSVENIWANYDSYFYGYVFDMTATSGVETVVGTDARIALDNAGNLVLSGDVNDVKVYSLNGACLVSVANPGNLVECGLQKGIYVVSAVLADGSELKVKLVR